MNKQGKISIWLIILIIIALLIAINLVYNNYFYSPEFDEIEYGKNYVEERLGEFSYEVIYIINTETDDGYNLAMVSMKSLGNRENQVWDGLDYLSIGFDNATLFRINIKSPYDSCTYEVKGSTLRNYYNAGYTWEELEQGRNKTDDEIDNMRYYRRLVEEEINENVYCY